MTAGRPESCDSRGRRVRSKIQIPNGLDGREEGKDSEGGNTDKRRKNYNIIVFFYKFTTTRTTLSGGGEGKEELKEKNVTDRFVKNNQENKKNLEIANINSETVLMV